MDIIENINTICVLLGTLIGLIPGIIATVSVLVKLLKTKKLLISLKWLWM